MNGKSPLTSKTMWLGIVELIAGVLLYLQGDAWFGDAFPQVVGAFGTIAGVLTLIVRQLTVQPLDWKPPHR